MRWMVMPSPYHPCVSESTNKPGMQQAERPVIAISMGDPGGIGPEVIVKALADPARRRSARYRIHGAAGPLESAAEKAGIEPFWWRVERGSDLVSATAEREVVLVDAAGDEGFAARASKRGGELSFGFVEEAIANALRGDGDPLRADAVCTAPISKHAWSLAGRGKYPGHTELLASRFRAKRVVMAFESPALRVALATAHVPLMDVRNVLTIGRVFDTIDLMHDACVTLGIESPRLAVCGLNPHAGEGGLIGDEDGRLIEPAIKVATGHGIDARGPFPGDTVFGRALAGEFDAVVAMYHDQGLIPVKLLAFDQAVNMTLGLSSVRTSPDHGTAFDLAGRNRANPGSMAAALDLAVRLCSAPASRAAAPKRASADRA